MFITEKYAKLIVLLAVMGTSFSSVFTRLSTAPSMVLVLYRMTAAALLLAVTKTPYFGYAPVNWLCAGGMVIFCTFLGHSVFSWGLKYLSPASVSTLQMMEPVGASVWGLLLFHEVPGILVIVGGILVIGGIVLYCRYTES